MSEEAKDARKKNSGSGQMHNSEEFANYVHAVSIPMKVVMVAIVVFFAGLIAYCVFGVVPDSITVAAVSDSSGSCTCYVNADDRSDIVPGATVEINGETYKVETISSSATCVDETIDEYALDIGDLSLGDYVFLVTVNGSVPQGVYKATLTKGYLQPLSVLLSD